ncbi:MAG TPA: 30S ribosomal protein S15 [Planctomycetaceae bacterium]|nr:30S ribosomal protein S15 [Planctomycetaceae bacterium]
MATDSQAKREIIEQFRRSDQDTGSAEVQIALLTQRIRHLTEHMKVHKKDFATRRGLRGLVSRRRRLLDYLRDREPQRYVAVIQRLGIRK